MTAHVSTLVYVRHLSLEVLILTYKTRIAGAETTATFLASMTAFLLQNTTALRKLREEIRGAFRSGQEIDVARAQALPYLQAVIQEGLRIHPPGSHGFPRLCSGDFIDGYWIPKGVMPR